VVVDDCTRECLRHLDLRHAGRPRARSPARRAGKPTTIVSDNGSELCSEAILCDGPTITRWPGTISRRGRAERLAESFIGHLRDELLNETLFRSLAHTRAVLEP
jgi:putative transposase